MKLVDALARFNRKERYWLLRNALGPTSSQLGEAFREKLGLAIGLEVPADAWWSMDYHLDWLVGALSLVGEASEPTDAHKVRTNALGMVMGNQEDMDLVVAFDNVLVLVEAKGETAWSNGQFASKVARLEKLRKSFLLPLEREQRLEMFFVVTSPGVPDGLTAGPAKQWEAWMCNEKGRPMHVPLEMPNELWKVTRWDPVLSKPAAVDTHWKITPARGATRVENR